MSCAIGCIRWLLFVFNFFIALCGLALLVPAILFHIEINNVPDKLESEVSLLVIGVIILGSIVFVIAFFGCCGAIKESHCMIITFAVLLLTILVIQVALAILAFVKLKGFDKATFEEAYRTEVSQYWKSESSRTVVDFSQTFFSCCGADGPENYIDQPGMNGTYPNSCCPWIDGKQDEHCSAQKVYHNGCSERVQEFFKLAGKTLGGIALGIAGVELVGIIFALCLANSIRNADRRAYRV